jgi:hypothetical protein
MPATEILMGRLVRVFAAFGGASLLVAVAAVAAPAGAASTPTTVTFASTAGCSGWAVPAGVTSIQAYTRGSAGQVDGGKGDAVSATFTVSANETLDVCVAVGRGTASSDGQTSDGGYGGGASGVAAGATFSTPLLVAGGGGGGSGPATKGGVGGNAGESQGSDGGATVDTSYGATGGGGGSTTVAPVGGGFPGAAGLYGGGGGGVGGSTSSSGPGSGGSGGAGADGGDGGGGGGGYYGGGGGGTGNGAGAGGGGGSDYCDTALVTSCAYDSGAGYGIGLGASGGNAEVTLTYYTPTPVASIARAVINSHKQSAKFTLKAKGALTEYQCALVKVNSGNHHKTPAPSYMKCSSPVTYKHLTTASYVFYVRAVGSGGTQAPAVTHRFKIS